ncbi:MAG TPA: ATP-grasp domain-containing protein [Gaiellaceae bacterium]|nr:ATP-grasp domain-containing protein [Gaiellaceae bacterium]
MRPLTVLVTASGAPGTAALLRALRMNGERRVRLVGSDMSPNAIGRHFCDAFYVVPPGGDAAFADTMLELAAREHVDAVLPQSSFDLAGLAEVRERFADAGVAVLVSPPDTIRRANDKAEAYAVLQRIGVPAPAWRRVTGGRGLAAAAEELGYPDRPVCFKPVFSSGSRGFRVLDPTVDRAKQLLGERPGNLAMRLTDVLQVLPEDGGPELLVMELAQGRERTIDGIANAGTLVLGHPKTREAMRAGLAMYFETLADDGLVELARRIVSALAIDHFFNIQLVGDLVIEINPRISTIVYQEDVNLPYLGVKHALGEISDEQLAALARRVRPTRRALRYFDQVEWDQL